MSMAEPRCSERRCARFWGVLPSEADEDVVTCEAFPDGIPQDIAYGDDPHTSPHAGDHGLRYKPE